MLFFALRPATVSVASISHSASGFWQLTVGSGSLSNLNHQSKVDISSGRCQSVGPPMWLTFLRAIYAILLIRVDWMMENITQYFTELISPIRSPLPPFLGHGLSLSHSPPSPSRITHAYIQRVVVPALPTPLTSLHLC
jgi:hypothetical protein